MNGGGGGGGGGSCFPVCSSSDEMKGCVEEPHVLAVDDNVVDRRLIERLLKSFSCRVTTAENGMRALEYLGLGDDQQASSSHQASEHNILCFPTLKVNMILTDYCMPGMTGYELLKKIKGGTLADAALVQESSHMKEVPVVIMSSENTPTRVSK
ncbi:hypothetical protein Ancab_034595 [Ancistrocladus abbreviatus]